MLQAFNYSVSLLVSHPDIDPALITEALALGNDTVCLSAHGLNSAARFLAE
jgi:hypothetical protein